MSTLATIDDVAAVAQPVPDGDAERVERLLELVTAWVQRYTGQTFFAVENDVVTLTPHDGVLRLPQRPVTAVHSVAIGDSTIDPSQYECSAGGHMRRLSTSTDSPAGSWPISGEWPWPPQRTTIDHDHGYDDIPGDLVLVVAEVVAERWLAGPRIAERKTGESIDGYSLSWAAGSGPTTWSPPHRQILDSYRRSGFASLRLG
jgi:hypothetical protein